MAIGRWPSEGQRECRLFAKAAAGRFTACVIHASSSAALSPNYLAEHRADRCRIEGHELERERHELVHRWRHSPQIEILEDRRIFREEHVMNRKILAVPLIHRRCVDTKQ